MNIMGMLLEQWVLPLNQTGNSMVTYSYRHCSPVSFPLLQSRARAGRRSSAPASIHHFPLLSGVLVGAGEGGEAGSAGAAQLGLGLVI
jgi:hypothetical protein